MRRHLADADATALAGNDIALAVRPGDCIALHGDLGAGKTTLARAVIRTLAADRGLAVPSPTFTLVQSYDARIPVAHFDLYRISVADELRELGLDEALQCGIALVEWPERAEGLLPADTIHVKLSDDGEGRAISITASADAARRIARSFEIRDFLEGEGWSAAERSHLTGDASARAYETVDAGSRHALLMNAPRQPDGPPIRDGLPYSRIAHLAESVTPFVAIDRLLTDNGFAAPQILASDLDAGLLLIEDLGRDGVLSPGGVPIHERYLAAADMLARLHAVDWPHEIAVGVERHVVPAYDTGALAIETELLIDWYVPFAFSRQATEDERREFAALWSDLFARLGDAEKSLVLRDFHSPNIVWRGDRNGPDRIGLIDFQDAVIGPSAYDVASLALDARVTIDAALEADIRNAYLAARGQTIDAAAFESAYAIMAAQRNTKILGIFVRLNERDGKPHYLKHLPRIRDYLERATRHPDLAGLRDLYRQLGVLPDGSR